MTPCDGVRITGDNGQG